MRCFNFVKQSAYIICIDSDGCAMDTMEIKHRECFGPQWIYTYGLEERFDECMKVWLDINLYSITRGINRFKGLALALTEMEKRGCKFDGLEEFINWTNETNELSNPALLAYTQKSSSECVEKALLWSIRTNRAVYNMAEVDKPFDNVKEAMDAMSEEADLVVVSSGNTETVNAEWTKHGLRDNCRALLCQEVGSKEYSISAMVRKGYDTTKMLMVGAAPEDKYAAEQNGIWYFPILVGKEASSWDRLLNEAFPKLLDGTFDEAYQEELNKEFEANLGV